MLDEIIARYDDMLSDLDTLAYTLTIPVSGTLTVQDAVRRLGADPAVLRELRPTYVGDGLHLHEPEPTHVGHGLCLYQVGAGIVTLGWIDPGEKFQEATDRLAGDGFRHWRLSFDIEGNTVMYARYGNAEGFLEHPEPGWIPFTHWTDHLGPLSAYTELFLKGYDSEDAEADVDITAACLAVIEVESGIRLDYELMARPYSLLPGLEA